MGTRSVSSDQIIANLKELYEITITYPEYKFFIGYTESGVNLNDYSDREMVKIFSPSNIVFEKEFLELYNSL